MNSYADSAAPPEADLKPLTPTTAMNASLSGDISELTKARLTLMVLITTLAGYAFASHGHFNWVNLVHTLIGTALVAVCSSILNQAMERDTDARMSRTERRPFVTRRLPLRGTVITGLVLGAVGLAELWWCVHPAAAVLAALTLAIYVVAYTPMKRLSSLNTLIGTIPGALPPLIGAAAARGHLNAEGWSLFALLAVWQLPHFYAIAWLYRDDFRNAGLRMVSVPDETGAWTGWHAVVTAAMLVPVSLLPAWIGGAGTFYAVVDGVLALVFLAMAIAFLREPNRASARRLFLTSIIYLPLVLAALAIDVCLRAH